MKKLVGFDLSGWRDLASRNWQIIPGEGVTFEGGPFGVSGGLGGVVVTLDEASCDPQVMGGIQSLNSPHGRGPGWGDVGAHKLRKRVVDLLRTPEDNIVPLAAALASLAPGGKFTGILSIDDTPSMRETAQESLLTALRMAGANRGLLIWRPVLAVLSMLENAKVAQAGKIGIVSHCDDGFSTQILKLRNDALPTPERQQVGRMHASGLGLGALLKQAHSLIENTLGDRSKRVHLKAAQAPWRLALGEVSKTEVMRAKNSDWEIFTPPATIVLPEETPPETIAEHLSSCDVVLFCSPATGHVSKEILEWLDMLILAPVLAIPLNSITLGALEAARRLQQNQPVYYDFLPQISTIVQDREGARNADLIPNNARLRAGETYRSEKPAKFMLQQNTTSLSIFLKKESVERPRKATVTLSTPPTKNLPVKLSVEQKPASGRARLNLISEGFSAPLSVNWDAAEELREDWQEIIEAQKPTLPTVPNRLLLPCGMETWEDQPRAEGLTPILERNLHAPTIDWKELADKLSARPEGKYAISSDGVLPEKLHSASRNALIKISFKAETDIRERLKGKGSNENHSLRFLTWQFHRCPQWMVSPMLDALEASHLCHPFRINTAATTLLLQGIGRAASEQADQHRSFRYLCGVPLANWNKNHLACAAFLLSRTDGAPVCLARRDVDFLAKAAVMAMQNSLGSQYTSKFIYAPFLLVGLLRWRLKEPSALVAGSDTVADELLQITKLVIDDLANKVRVQPQLRKYHEVLMDVVEELKGQGTNPNLLLDLESLA